MIAIENMDKIKQPILPAIIFLLILNFIFFLFKLLIISYAFLCVNGDWGLGIGDWGLGIGDWAQSPIPNPQSPIPIHFLSYIKFY
jgi:hypothetical protein